MNTASRPQLLQAYPLVRAQCVDEASERIGRVFSPHRLALRRGGGRLDVQHNQVRLDKVSINVLRYGADVVIDPGERGDFYLIQLPLAGSARLACGDEQVRVDRGVLSVLQPHTPSLMEWSGGCTMVLVQAPRAVVQRRAAQWGLRAQPRFALAYSRGEAAVGAWWQAALDLTRNIDRFGQQWLRHPAACMAMEEFLLSAFTVLLPHAAAAPSATPQRGDERCLRRAKEYVHAHLDRALSSAEIAGHACVTPRTLEAVFKRNGEPPPLAYARRFRLQAVHAALATARRDGRPANVTEVALAHGFIHMGRFAAQYREQFGCTPSETLRPH